MADPAMVAKQFVEFYYSTFDGGKREELVHLYREHSVLTFESQFIQGAQAIVAKLKELPFEKIEHKVDTQDAQPAGTDGSISVLVTGALLTDGESRPMSYAQSFHLKPEGGSYYVQNDIFKLVYPS